MISYELILSTAVIIVIILTGSFNITTIIENQQSIWFVVPLLPIFIIFFISILAETNRTPFDLPEAAMMSSFFYHPTVFPAKTNKTDLVSLNVIICWKFLYDLFIRGQLYNLYL
jgi:hypothetical protein